jgi:hypothetical protein
VSDLAQAFLLSVHGGGIALICEVSDALQDGAEVFIVGEPPPGE